MAIKYYKLHCEICGYTNITDGSDCKLVECKRSKIQKDIPKCDSSTGEASKSTFISLPKKYKCPKCGRLVSPRKIQEPELENKAKNNYDKDFNTGSKGGFERL